MLKLRVIPADGQPFDFPVELDSIVIGRSSGSDLVIRDRFLSRRHARLYLQDEKLFIEDLGARNGTYLNRNLLEQPLAVGAGDEIKLAGSVIKLYDGEQPPDEEPSTGETSREISLENASIIMPAAELLHKADSTTGIRGLASPDAYRRQTERLQILNEVHSALGKSLELPELLDLILDRVFDHLRPEQAVIFLQDKSGEYYRAASRTLSRTDEELVPSKSLISEVIGKRLAALVLDVETDIRFAEAQSIMMSGVRSLLAAPLLEEEEGALGMIVLSSKGAVKQFTEDDLELLVSVASVAALRIRNAALSEEAAQRRILEEELALARRIQVALLPQDLPEIPGYELYGGNIPSRGVSGDYFQIVEHAEQGNILLMVADVSGKGMAASLLTASLEALSAGPIEVGRPPDEICLKINRRLYRRTPPEKFATAFFALLEPVSGRIQYANAGHNQGLVVRHSGECELLESTGMPLGLMPDAEFKAGATRLEPGDLLVLYTDGIVEAFNPDDEEYGIERLIAACVRSRALGLDEVGAAIDDDLDEFVRGVPFADDRTLVMARRDRG